MRHQLVSGKTEANEYRVLERWMREAATLLQGFRYYAPKYRPFDELEVPGVSLLVASAAAAGYYPIAEYEIQKIGKKDRRTRRNGRADLWFIANNESYSFEFKRAWNESSEKQLEKCMSAALVDINDIPKSESDHAFAAVIAPIYDQDCIERYAKFNTQGYTFSLGDANADVFIYLRRREL